MKILLTPTNSLKHILHNTDSPLELTLAQATRKNWLTDLPESVVDTRRPDGTSPVLLVCEHASRYIPRGLAALGLDEAAAKSHIAWDPGALALAKHISDTLSAPLVAQKVSRLVYDCNRPPESDQAIRAMSEVYHIPGNAALPAGERQNRIDHIYKPFQSAVAGALDRGRQNVLVTIHSFTPVFNGVPRAVEIGILHDKDSRLADAMLKAAMEDPAFNVQRNAPYGPEDEVTHTLKAHALPRGLLNVMIEVRNDLLADEAGIESVATWLEKILKSALKDMDGEP